MKKFIFALLSFFFLSFSTTPVPSMAKIRSIKQGIYTVADLNLSSNTMYTVQNNSFS